VNAVLSALLCCPLVHHSTARLWHCCTKDVNGAGRYEYPPPCVPVVSNVTAKGETEPSKLRQLLVDQITGMVRWRESVIWMKDQSVTDMIEIGAGKVLSGLARRIDREIACESVGTPEGIEALITKLKG